MKLPWLAADTPFPPAEFALTDPDGLLAAGADLSIDRLVQAYSNGIFPWYSEGEPILWWSPDPRMVLACQDFAPSHSLRKLLRQIASHEHEATPRIEIRVDTAFATVMAECAAPREGQPGTWITAAMRQAYRVWHEAGYVHSVETWIDGELAGGLYGISLGRMFFGESMFTRAPNASKIALAYLVRYVSAQGGAMDRLPAADTAPGQPGCQADPALALPGAHPRGDLPARHRLGARQAGQHRAADSVRGVGRLAAPRRAPPWPRRSCVPWPHRIAG